MTEDSAGYVAAEEVRGHVRERYGKLASTGSCCAPSADPSGCCGEASSVSCSGESSVSVQLGYSPEELASVPEGANLGLGCGNPTGLAFLNPGDIVLDLGSGAGIDCFLAARRVGPVGQVIGVDMTPEMVAKARANARAGGYRNVEFRLGEIEHLPVPNDSVDVIVSNCVINLVPDKSMVYREAFRVLRPGGRLALSDVVATRPITPQEKLDPTLWSSCSSGALEAGEVESKLREAGFEEIDVHLKMLPTPPDSLQGPASLGVVPADIRAIKPRRPEQ